MTPDMIPLILAKRSDACLWDMGDYLIRVAGESDDKRVRDVIREVSDELIAHGHAQYTVAYLNRLHRTACAFPVGYRRPDLSWEVHATAGSPVTLQAVIAKAEADH